MSDTQSTPSTGLKIFKHIGPGLVTACVVIGPGSILTSSSVGAKNGYALGWIVVIACLCMMVYTTLGAKLGVISGESTGKLITDRAGRGVAAFIGVSVFFIASAFQFGNNVGVHSAVQEYVDFDQIARDNGLPPVVEAHLKLSPIIVFNAIALMFLFGFRNLYKVVERLMATFVALMLIAFAINLFNAAPDPVEVGMGLIPLAGSENQLSNLDLSVMGLVGTTFVIPAAFYQSYLVRFKGWKEGELRDGLIDARVSATIMALITLMLMYTAGSELRGQTLGGVGDVAAGLRTTFGEFGHLFFCLGLFAAAYSSFLVNSMIGGFMLADGLGLGSTPDDKWPRLLTAAVLLTGAGMGAYVVLSGNAPVPAIIAAQAVTVLAAPAVAAALWWLSNREDVMRGHRSGPVMNVLAGFGFLLLLGIAANTAINGIPSQLKKLRDAPAEQAVEAEAASPASPASRVAG
ncbi:MAG: hypothetical protein DWQ34_09025 [Planctomycetota bacterium]|nr:MAG: hypothetical protein DWQ34_09025 [Planctomycetota bacterium]REK20192.1 MAG: hypothetical protein DWQ41_25965 [Planctomycetota bacterium]REK35355.1 MAG: hypothetical protein DWQ45_11560 [Planctomycetota bacterium]